MSSLGASGAARDERFRNTIGGALAGIAPTSTGFTGGCWKVASRCGALGRSRQCPLTGTADTRDRTQDSVQAPRFARQSPSVLRSARQLSFPRIIPSAIRDPPLHVAYPLAHVVYPHPHVSAPPWITAVRMRMSMDRLWITVSPAWIRMDRPWIGWPSADSRGSGVDNLFPAVERSGRMAIARGCRCAATAAVDPARNRPPTKPPQPPRRWKHP